MTATVTDVLDVDLGDGLRIMRVNLDTLNEQTMNAQLMPPEMFNQLVANIKKRGNLESLPYVARVGDKLEIVSGHHRVRAASAAGMSQMVVLVDESGLTRSQIAAKQLAHNSLNGASDPDMVRQIANLIIDVDDKVEAFLPSALLNELDASGQDDLLYPKVVFEWESVTLSFLPHQFVRFKELVDALNGPQALLGVAERTQFEAFATALKGYARLKNIKSVSMAVHQLTEIANQHLAEDALTRAEAGELGIDSDKQRLLAKSGWVSLQSLFAGAHVPPDAAAVIRQAIEAMLSSGAITTKNQWQALEYLAADYLAGVREEHDNNDPSTEDARV